MNLSCTSKRIKRPLFIFAVCLVGALIASAFAAPVLSIVAPERSEVSVKGAGYSAVLYDNSNGLPTSEANDIVQSEDGFIWIGGYSGLVRYDGNEFYRYESSSGIASVVCLCMDSRNRLWIGTNDSGIAVFKDNTFRFYGRTDGLRSSSIRSIVEDGDGCMIIATTMGIAYIDGGGELGIIDDNRINSEYVCELFAADDGVIYGVTLNGSFFTMHHKNITGFYSGTDMGLGIINTIYPDPLNEGYVYLGSQESHIYYGDLRGGFTDYTVLSAEPLETINAIRYYDGAVWVCSDSGVGVFDSGHRFTKFEGLPMTNSIDHVVEDYEGNLWFTSSRQGIMKIVGNRFVDISDIAGLDPLVVNTTCLSGTDLYIGTDTGLHILDKDDMKIENGITELLDGIRIRCIRSDKDGYLWMCTYSVNGLIRYDPKTGQTLSFTEDNGMASNRVRMITQLADGSMATATNAGMNIIKDGKVTALYGSNVGITNLEILCIEEADDGILYLGTDGGGIYAINGSKISRIGIDDGLKSEVILRLKKDPFDSGIIWIITSNSLSYMKDGAVTTVGSFPYSNNFDVFFDKYERAWILSSNGIHIVKRSYLLGDAVEEYTLFDKDYGLPGIATANSYSYIKDDGELYVSASTGVYSVNNHDDTGGGSEIKLSIPFISVDGRYVWVNESDTLRIPADCKRLNIYANAFTYSLSNPHLSYRLEGFDDDEKHVTKQEMTYASYTNLKGGTYRFVLSMVNDVTGEVEKTITLTIVKESALYEQLWFIITAAVLGVGVIVFVTVMFARIKMKRLEKKQAETKELIDEMTRVFSGCVDMKDAYTNGHSGRVAKYTAMIAEKLGKTPAEVEEIYNIALLHDIGKISIPDSILNKPGRLDDDEFAVMKSHAQRGYDILKDIKIDPNLALGAGYHHEKYDGSGYPSGLKGTDIPEIARIIAVADTFDAMYSTRPYRKKMPIETVAEEIARNSGKQFAPDVVAAFLELVKEGKLTDDTVQ